MSSSPLEIYAVCAGTLGLTLYVTAKCLPTHNRRRRAVFRTHNTHSAVQALLNPGPPATKAAQLAERAAANIRLVVGFGLGNTFVRADIGTNRAFRRRAADIISTSPHPPIATSTEYWPALAEIAGQAVNASLPVPSDTVPGRVELQFDEFVQCGTLRWVICFLFLRDASITPSSLDSTHIRETAKLINTIWLLSKQPQRASEVDTLRAQLQTRLDVLLPEFKSPLDLLIPTWETFWRVVAAAIAEVALSPDLEARNAFLDLLENPTTAQFYALRIGGTGPSANHFVLETLRLHPPVARMTRVRVVNSASLLTDYIPSPLLSILPNFVKDQLQLAETVTDVADVEGAQRSAHWATPRDPANPPARPIPSPHTFDASRFVAEPEREADVLAFGHGPLKCIAAKWAPMAVGIVVGAILERLDEAGYHLVRGERIGGREGWEGWRVVQL